ncbi:hypothetical protein [Lysinibacillus sphaericus]|uniref:hypothetical protein n=1 Tax=Lysinibacillus TaxID=400634 RepID=UPI0003A74988|nr:hypothetical protein [Lysinibacillus sphaericus]
MSFILFAVIHILIGIALIYFYGKLPKAIAVLFIVFFAFSIIYGSAVILFISSTNGAP